MDNTELYRASNSQQRVDNELTLKEFVPRLTWSENENILDVGSGPGDVTAEILQPYLPSSARLVGVDIKQKMVDYANKNYSSENIHFIVLDFSTKNITDVFQADQFSKIFSFYCFHWIRDLEQATKNVRFLLQPGGEFLISMVTSYRLFEIYRIMSKKDKWKNYMKDIKIFVPLFFDSDDICREMRQLLTSQGLDVLTCEERNKTFCFHNMEACTDFHESLNPFVKGMSDVVREQHMAYFIELMKENGITKESDSGEIFIHYPMLILYGRRPISSEQILK